MPKIKIQKYIPKNETLKKKKELEDKKEKKKILKKRLIIVGKFLDLFIKAFLYLFFIFAILFFLYRYNVLNLKSQTTKLLLYTKEVYQKVLLDKLVLNSNENKTEIPTQEKAKSEDDLYLNSFIERLNTKSFYTTTFKAETETSDTRDRKIYINKAAEKDVNFYLYINLENDLDTNWLNFLSLIDSEAFKKRNIKNLEYIDMRFGNKIFLKDFTFSTSTSGN